MRCNCSSEIGITIGASISYSGVPDCHGDSNNYCAVLTKVRELQQDS